MPDSIVGGNPAKLIRKRFDDSTIDLLLRLSWWNWDVEKITQNLNHITSCDIKELKKLIV